MKNPIKTTLIPASHLSDDGVLEVDATWQNNGTLAILCHPNPKAGGDMNNKVITTAYRHYRERGMSVVRFNYRGVGTSSGQIEYGDGEFFDTLAVLRWAIDEAKNRQIHLDRLTVCGFSFGGFVACRVADFLVDNPLINLDKLVLIAPSIEKNDPTGLRLPVDTLMIYGDDDEWVNPNSMVKFADKFRLRTHVIQDTGHFFNGRLRELDDALRSDL
ncbi:MAG: alpha/beta fold hydrolase [Moraxella sp.]|nr:alpha/beta fold hydrolase [Moraxella sp.]